MTYGDDAYCTVDEAKTLNAAWTPPSGITDEKLEAAIVRASQRIAALTGRHFGQTSRTLVFDGNGNEFLSMAEQSSVPLVSITEIRQRDYADDDWDADGEVLPTETYRISGSGLGILRVPGSSLTTDSARTSLYSDVWERGFQNYRVIGKFGTAFIPDDIKLACVYIVREESQPKYLKKLETYVSENFADGYSYTRRYAAQADKEFSMTGHTIIDNLLAPYVDEAPDFVVFD